MSAAKRTVVNSAVIFWRESVCPPVIFADVVARRPFVTKEEQDVFSMTYRQEIWHRTVFTQDHRKHHQSAADVNTLQPDRSFE